MARFCLYWRVLPCVIFEDEHLLVVNKPAGLNTHSPSPHAGEGLYEWLRHREPRWAGLAIIHRLDKETSGLIVFSKSQCASRSLTAQFTARSVHKRYLLLTNRPPARADLTVRSRLVRAGEKYVTARGLSQGELAETRFKILERPGTADGFLLQAEPLTGRTHQIRVHAAEQGFPIRGDTLYGGEPAPRLCLHAVEISFNHPDTGAVATFKAPPDFTADPRLALRRALLDPAKTDAFRLIHGARDGWRGCYVDRLGDWLLSQGEAPLSIEHLAELERFARAFDCRGAYHKRLTRHLRKSSPAETCPQLALGDPAPDRFQILENGLSYELSFNEGYSVGLFLDQRDNRRRLLTGHIAEGFSLTGAEKVSPAPVRTKPNPEESGPVRPQDQTGAIPTALNTFAYTCAFSLCAAKAGFRTTSLDLSKKYLDWGKRNFALNRLEPAGHDFICGDVFDWLRRFGKKGRRFDLILLDPPTFSQSKERGVFRAERDYSELAASALPLLKKGGVLFASTNAAAWPPGAFLSTLRQAVSRAGRVLEREHYLPQPPDFPISRNEPGYLKTVWLKVG
jgi:23S rRNA (cytosine1962-C5)-methyltransferase